MRIPAGASSESVKRQLGLVKSLARAGYAGLGLFVGTIGVWAFATPLTGAIVAPAVVVAQNNIRKVQHATGGIVHALNVREGDRVKAGDVVVRLDETVARTTLQITSRQLDEAMARAARLEAERDKTETLRFPLNLTARLANPEIAQLLAAELGIMAARRASRESAAAQFSARIAQLRSEIAGLATQLTARSREHELNAGELDSIRVLFSKNLTPISRLSALERAAVQLEGARGALLAQIAQAEGKISELDLQILHIDRDWNNEVHKDLRDAEAKIAELHERRSAAEDQFRRLDIRTPLDGVVHQLGVTTAGAVIAPGETVMSIVPMDERLYLEARIAPPDYDQIRVGQPVIIKLNAFNPRTNPDLRGEISRMAADTSREGQNGPNLYTIRVSLSADEPTAALTKQLRSGMQADVYIQTSERTPAAYLLQPLADQISRAFRER